MLILQKPSGLTWCPQFGLAGRAGQRKTLAKPVHPVKADGDVWFGHGLQIFCRGKRNSAGLVHKRRLCWAESGHPGRTALKRRRGEIN